MKLDTGTPAARRQYDANVAFARAYVSRLAPLVAGRTRPRVLVTGFGRFPGVADNATGHIVGRLAGIPYPVTAPPEAGAVDLPGAQVATGVRVIEVPGVGEVDVCAMIVPVSWGLAAILVARELDALAPSLVLLNGVAGPRQPLWLELGAANQAALRLDGSNLLCPCAPRGETLVKITEDAARAQPSLLSWGAVAAAAEAEVARHGGFLPGVALAGFPRPSNAYLCNEVTWVTGWLMRHPGRAIDLLRASDAARCVSVRVDADLRGVPRAFVHWPSDLDDHEAAAEVLRAMIVAQLTAREPPTPGDDRDANDGLRGGGLA